jgi:hypothetical protein
MHIRGKKFLPFENLRAGLRVSLPSIFLGVVSPSNRGLINVGSGLRLRKLGVICKVVEVTVFRLFEELNLGFCEM